MPPSRLRRFGEPRRSSLVCAALYGVSDDGMLLYAPGAAAMLNGQPVWVDRDGRESKPLVATDLEALQFPRFSPDGRRLVLNISGDLWVYDLSGHPPIKLTFDGSSFAALWTPDGQRLVYETAGGVLHSIAADGSSRTSEPVSPEGSHFHPHGWSADGRELVAVELGTPTGANVVRIPVGGKTTQPIVQTSAEEGSVGAAVSPDGRWLAYSGDQTGQTEIWVQPNPGPGAPIRISPNGGIEPVWARSGRELYYLEGNKLLAVALATQPTFTFTPPVLLFERRYRRTGQPPSYDVAPDGRFLMIKSTEAETAAQLVVVLNWFQELQKRTGIK